FASRNAATVVQLVEGQLYPIENGYTMISSVTLVMDEGLLIIVDSPSYTDDASKERMLKELSANGVTPSQIHFMITTHGHPDHFGHGNFFPNARHFFASYEFTESRFTRTQLFNTNEMRLTKNVELWNTPGHTAQDISLVIYNVPGHGTVGIV
ncbi:Protein C03F11.2, partial [Aphelenchoides avenae]